MEQFDHIIIGFGKGGKTLAGALASKGFKVAIIERSEKMFGGTCINVACIPTKSLENNARISFAQGGSFADRAKRYSEAIGEKRKLTSMLRQKNYDKALSSGVKVIVGEASFVDSHKILVRKNDNETIELVGDKIYINTGSKTVIPKIDGIGKSKYVYTSETMMELDTLPKSLIIIGGGYIGLEFASYYANFGSEVTVLQRDSNFMPKEDEEISYSVLNIYEKRGIQVVKNVEFISIEDIEGMAKVLVKVDGEARQFSAEAVLVATGRKPNTEGLNLENAGVKQTNRGAVETDKYLKTNVPHIWAMGDVVGGQQFTYISLDDSRIVKSQLLGTGNRTTENRGEVPYTVFIDPPLSRVGLTEKQAVENGYNIKVAKMQSAAIPKAQVLKRTDGMIKVIIDSDTNKILGAHLFCAESYEMINLIKLAVDSGMEFTVLRDSVYTHPTMTEAFNDLFGTI